MIAPVTNGKIIPSSYGSIHHLPGSKMIDDRDKLLGEQEITMLTKRRRNPNDLVIVTEKVDGMNCSVLRRGKELYPLVRKGYDVRTNPNQWIRNFAQFVENNEDRFMELLYDGERLCGEWMIKTHTLRYELPNEPFIVFDLIDSDNERINYISFRHRIVDLFTPAGLVHMGEAIDPQTAIQILGQGYHGVVGGEPEGVVYRYEDAKNGFVCSGKYVSNKNVGNQELFSMNINFDVYNVVKSKYKIYIPK